MNQNEFISLGISETLGRALEAVGYERPTPIQAQSIPHLLEGRDLLGIAQTGTGKTAAFALPLLQRLSRASGKPQPRKPRALVLAPTRELAQQITDECAALGRFANLRQTCIFGGVGQQPQIKALAQGLDLLVATPGRLLDLIGQGHADLSEVCVLVLDEADRLLDMGFIRDVRRLVAATPASRQSLLFSATMPTEVAALAREMLRDPVRVDVSPEEVTVKAIKQKVVPVMNADKRRVLEHLLRDDSVARAIVFTRTKHGANKVAKQLETAGIGAEAIHGNKSQNARQRALQRFKAGEAWVLVATDIASRGIDIDGVTHVFNYELPHEPESYVHRIGRTGRAGAKGVAWSLVDPSENARLRGVERLIGFPLSRVDLRLEPAPRDADAGAAGEERSAQSASSARHGSGRQLQGRQVSNRGSGTGAGGNDSPRRRSRRRRSRQAA
ncbi:MAG: DEAD/DEAH box helicase [Pseudomonadales bacterium]